LSFFNIFVMILLLKLAQVTEVYSNIKLL